MRRKEKIISGLIEVRGKILAKVSNLPPEKQDEVFLGIWTIKDFLAHLVGWDYTNIEAIEEIRVGQSPSVNNHWDPDWASYNSQLVQNYKCDDYNEMLGKIKSSHKALIRHIELLPAQHIDKDFGIRSAKGRNITVDFFLQYEIEDEERHYDQICNWLDIG